VAADLPIVLPTFVPNAPPATNRGVQNAPTPVSLSRWLVDWLECTFPDVISLDLVQALFGSADPWTPLERGGLGYTQGHLQGVRRLFTCGKAGMGTHVVLSGQGCRELEGLEQFSSWSELLGSLWLLGAKITRFDLAYDDGTRLLDMGRIAKVVRSGCLVSRWKDAFPKETVKISTGEVTGRTWHFGSGTSDMQCRIYDKAQEQGLPGLLPDGFYGPGIHWIRVELEARRDRAESLARCLVENGPEAVCAVILGYLDFKERGSSPQRTRWNTLAWWTEFLATAKKDKLATEAKVRTMEKTLAWVARAVGPSLGLILDCNDGDLSWIVDTALDGKERWNSWQKDQAASAQTDRDKMLQALTWARSVLQNGSPTLKGSPSSVTKGRTSRCGKRTT